MATQADPLALSEDLLYSVKTDADASEWQRALARVDRDRLARTLSTDARTIAFWLNCYNAFVQLLLEEGAGSLDSSLARWRLFECDHVPVAGVQLSLNDIVHGLLRGSKHPLGLGYLPRLFPGSFEREFRVESVDPRVHFALNWGDETCAPISVYTPESLDDELNVATEWYLETNVWYDRAREVARVPALFLRYRGDFGGKPGIVEFLHRYGVVPESHTPRLRYDLFPRTLDVQEWG